MWFSFPQYAGRFRRNPLSPRQTFYWEPYDFPRIMLSGIQRPPNLLFLVDLKAVLLGSVGGNRRVGDLALTPPGIASLNTDSGATVPR